MNPKRIIKTNSYVKIEDEIKIKYTQAIVEYKKWSFIISQEKWPSCNPDKSFEIRVIHEDLYWDNMYLTNKWMWYAASNRITSFDEALDRIKDFISNELK